MDTLKLIAYAANRFAWSFCIREAETGLLLPVVRGGEIDLSGVDIQFVGEVLLSNNRHLTNKQGILRLSLSNSGRIVCDHGEVSTVGQIVIYDDITVDCRVIIDGFGAAEGAGDAP